jgi:hypothetical protein
MSLRLGSGRRQGRATENPERSGEEVRDKPVKVLILS